MFLAPCYKVSLVVTKEHDASGFRLPRKAFLAEKLNPILQPLLVFSPISSKVF